MTAKTQEPVVKKLPGKWAKKRITTQVMIYASFDAENQFMTQTGKMGVPVEVVMEDGKVERVPNAMPVKPESVHIYWPYRKMRVEWFNPKNPTAIPSGALTRFA